VLAWSLDEPLYAALAGVPGLTVFALSHRPAEALPGWLPRLLGPPRVICAPNLGYDWGGYQQFLAAGAWRGFEAVFFLHDDVILHDPGLFAAAWERLQAARGLRVIGNGRNDVPRPWPATHPHCYAHSAWKPPHPGFVHDTVRGSFLAAGRPALETLGSFEVLWDRRGWFGVGAGNWSLRATGGKIQDRLGPEAFEFLSERYRASPFLQELERGQPAARRAAPPPVARLRYALLRRISAGLMRRYFAAATPAVRRAWARRMQALFSRI
jgi:hypothetical protein